MTSSLRSAVPAAVALCLLLVVMSAGCSSKSPASPTPAVPLPTVGTFSMSLTDMGSGESAKLSWAVSGATTVQIDNGLGVVAASGSVDVTPAATTTYTLTATNATGNVTKTAAVKVHAVERQGSFTVRGTFAADLDGGKEVASLPGADFLWNQETAVVRAIQPTNNTKFSVVGPVSLDSVKYSAVAATTLSGDRIDGSANANNKIPNGTIVVGSTDEGRLVKFRIDTNAYNMTLTFVLWAK
jgi:hypothetical protein